MATLKLVKTTKPASTGPSSKKPSTARGATVALSAAARRRGRVADPDAADKPARQARVVRDPASRASEMRRAPSRSDGQREHRTSRNGEAPVPRDGESAPGRRSSETPIRRRNDEAPLKRGGESAPVRRSNESAARRSENPRASQAPRSFENERGQRPPRSDDRRSAGAASDPRRSEARARRDSERPTRNSEGYAPKAPRSDAPRGDTAGGDLRRNDMRRNEMRNSRPDSTRPDTHSSRRDTSSSRRDSTRPDTRSSRPDTRGNSRADVRSNRTGSASHPESAHNVVSHSAQTPRINMQDGVRLSKRMSEEGLASRREADQWIERGWVKVDGQIVAELGTRVLPTQQITVDARARNQQAQQVTILLNKPVGYVSGQAEDGHLPAVTLIKPENHWAEDTLKMRLQNEHLRGLAPAGRLDIDSVGLLVLTQNGRVAKQLIGANSSIDKEYLVRVKYLRGERLPEDQLALLNHGLELDGVPLQPARVEWQNEDQLRFVLREGKKRQIRRMCEMVGLEVRGLKRVRIGRVRLGGLPTGQWRYLGPDEIFWAD